MKLSIFYVPEKVNEILRKNKMRIIKTFLLSFIAIYPLKALEINCRLEFNIKGLENKKIVLGYEYGNKQIVLDTIRLTNEGKGYYASKSRLIGGIYVVVFPNQKYFEVLVNDEQFFTINSDTSDLFKNLTIEGSEESELFRQYQSLANEFDKKNNNKEGHNRPGIISNNHLAPVNSEEKIQLEKFIAKIILEKPKTFLATYLKMQKEPDNLENKSIEHPKPNKEAFLKRYQFIKNHYFDNIQFQDRRILRTRLIYEKLEYYFNKLVTQNDDSLIAATDYVIGLTKGNDEATRFVLNFLYVNFRNTRNPGQEKALVYLADNYYLNGKAPWAEKNFIRLLKARTDMLRPTLLGNSAPNIEMQTLEGKPLNLKDIKADYLIVYFWSPDCTICKSEITKIYGIFKNYKSKGVQVFAVYTHADKEICTNFLAEKKIDWINVYDPLLKSNFVKLYNVNITPKLYLLDKDKKIVSKNINAFQLEQFLKEKLK
jgi:peroxiredoxin